MQCQISKRIFWRTAALVALIQVMWVAHVLQKTVESGWMDRSGIIFWLLLASPAFLGIGGACGWLVAALFSFMSRKSYTISNQAKDSISQNEPSRLTIATMLGCCFATTTYLVLQDQIISIGFTLLILTSVLLSSGGLILGILHFLSKRGK